MEKMVKNFFKNKKILITGATGFKGAWLCMILKLKGANILAIGYKPNNNQTLFDRLNLRKKLNLKYVDVRDYEKVEKIIKKFKPSIVFHMAAQPLIIKSYKEPVSTININAIGTMNILEALRKVKSIKSIVCITSDKCYANNNSTIGFKETDMLGGADPYSASKASAEIIINAYRESFFKNTKIGLASARAGNVIGGGDWSTDRLIPDVIRSILNKKTIFIRNPGFNRPWQHVLEPLNGYLILAEKLYRSPDKFSSAWNFGSKKNTVTSVHEVVKNIVRVWGAGRIHKKKFTRLYEQKNLQLNITKAQTKLKWSPKYSIFKSIEVTTKWYKEVCLHKMSPEEVTKNQILNFFRN